MMSERATDLLKKAELLDPNDRIEFAARLLKTIDFDIREVWRFAERLDKTQRDLFRIYFRDLSKDEA